MSDIIDKTYKLLDTLDNSDIIKNLTYYKNRLLKNNDILEEIKKTNNNLSNQELITLKKKIYQDEDYKNYIHYYNELFYIVLKINKKYSEYTDTKE